MNTIINSRKILTCGLSTCIAISSTQAVTKKKNVIAEKPNVLFIIMDDMCDWAHFLGGNNQVISPNLDKLASQGISFMNAYTAVPLSNPSRTAMFTGIQPFITGVYNNQQNISDSPIANSSLFMPQHFKNNGYTTVCSGKILHTKPSLDVMKNMWDDMDYIDGGYGPFVKNSVLPPNLHDRWRNYEEWTGPDTDFSDVVNSQKMIEYLGQKHNKPFFAAMGFYRPHNPYTVPKRYFDIYDLNKIKRPKVIPDDLNDVPQYAIDHFIGEKQRETQRELSNTDKSWEQLVRAYLACVSFTDDRIGMIVEALNKSPYADNTIIVLVGDNGFHHGEKERWGKSALWREACHVPIVIVPAKNDNRFTKGECKTPVSLIDLYPTLIDMCKLPVVKYQLAGNSLTPILTNINTKWDKPTISTYLPGNFTIHSGEWNFIKYVDGSEELYNISKDEDEFENLAGKPEYKDIINKLSLLLPKSWHEGIKPSSEQPLDLRKEGLNPQKNDRPKSGKGKRKNINDEE